MSDKLNVIVCQRQADAKFGATSGSEIRFCYRCSQSVWLDPNTLTFAGLTEEDAVVFCCNRCVKLEESLEGLANMPRDQVAYTAKLLEERGHQAAAESLRETFGEED